LAGVFATLLLWTVGYGLELASVSLPAKLFWANLQFIGLLAMPVLWLGVMRKALGKPALPAGSGLSCRVSAWRSWRSST